MSLAGNTKTVVGVPAAPTAGSRVYRCEYCRCIVLYAQVQQFGGCKECGSRRIRIAFKLTDEEVEAAQAEGYQFDDDQWTDDIQHAYNDEH